MSGVNIEYKGESIATIPDTGSKTIKTQGKYCEGDILVEYEAPPTPTPALQSKTVTPTTSQQSVTPDSGYDGLSDVTVNATPLEAKSVTPTTEQQVVTPTAPNIGFDSVTVEAVTSSIDANITAGNIKKDVLILGVTGTYEGNPNANLDAYIQGDLTDIVFNGTNIHKSAFYESSIRSISMPNVVNIGQSAFQYCDNLELDTLPIGLVTMGQYTFKGASKITVSKIPDGVTNIPRECFRDCTSIQTMEVSSNLVSIAKSTFWYCTNLVTFDLSNANGIISIQSDTFSNTTCTFLFRDQTQLEAYADATNWSALADRFQIKGV